MATENRDRPADPGPGRGPAAEAPKSGPDPRLGGPRLHDPPGSDAADEVIRKVGILVSRFRFPEQITRVMACVEAGGTVQILIVHRYERHSEAIDVVREDFGAFDDDVPGAYFEFTYARSGGSTRVISATSWMCCHVRDDARLARAKKRPQLPRVPVPEPPEPRLRGLGSDLALILPAR